MAAPRNAHAMTGGGEVTVFICITCKSSDADTVARGQLLFDAVTVRLSSHSAIWDAAIRLTPVKCLAVCKRPCTVALAGSGKWTSIVGDLDPEAHVEDVIAADLLPSEIRGSGYGALAVVTGVGDLFSSFMVGWLWAAFGAQVAFSAAAALMAVGILLMLHLSMKKTQRL